MTKVSPAEVKTLADSGLDTDAIAKRFGLTRVTVQRKIRIAEGRAGPGDLRRRDSRAERVSKPIQYAQREVRGELRRAEDPPCSGCGVRAPLHAEFGCGRRLDA